MLKEKRCGDALSMLSNRNTSDTNKEFHYSRSLQRQASIAMFWQGKKITLIMPWFKIKIVMLLKFHKWLTITAKQQDSDYIVIMQVSQQVHSYYPAIRRHHLEKLHLHWLLQSPLQVIYKYMILISRREKKTCWD